MAKLPAERFATAGALADAATAAINQTPIPETTMVGSTSAPSTLIGTSPAETAVGHSPEPTAIAPPPRHRAVSLAIVGIIATAALVAGVWAWHSSKPDQPALGTATQPRTSTGSPALPPSAAAPRPAPLTAEQVVRALAAKVPTAKLTVTFDEQTDPNHLLGRPNGYLSKASLVDSRIPRNEYLGYDRGAVASGGSVEVFTDTESANARKTYIQTISKGFPASAEYDYVSGPILLRISSSLTPSQASDYERALQGLGR